MTREKAINYLYSSGFSEKQVNTIAKAFEPIPKNELGVDCISREQAQTEIEMKASRYTISKERGGMGQVEWSDQLIKVSDAVDILRHLPSVAPQEPKWILDSERLPEKTGRYLITYCYRDKIETQEAVYVEDEEEIKWYDTTGIEITLAVIAWMPLPEPYSEVEE